MSYWTTSGGTVRLGARGTRAARIGNTDPSPAGADSHRPRHPSRRRPEDPSSETFLLRCLRYLLFNPNDSPIRSVAFCAVHLQCKGRIRTIQELDCCVTERRIPDVLEIMHHELARVVVLVNRLAREAKSSVTCMTVRSRMGWFQISKIGFQLPQDERRHGERDHRAGRQGCQDEANGGTIREDAINGMNEE